MIYQTHTGLQWSSGFPNGKGLYCNTVDNAAPESAATPACLITSASSTSVYHSTTLTRREWNINEPLRVCHAKIIIHFAGRFSRSRKPLDCAPIFDDDKKDVF